MKVLFVSNWMMYGFPGGYESPLVARTIDQCGQQADVAISLSGEIPQGHACPWPIRRHGSNSKASGPEFGTSDVVVALNSDALPAASAVTRSTGAKLVLFSLGGLPLRHLVARGAIRAIWHYYAPLMNRLSRALIVDDTTQRSAVEITHLRSPETPILLLPVPHGPFSPDLMALPRQEAKRLLGLPLDKQIVGWAGRLDVMKAPGDLLDLARRVPDRQFVMAGPEMIQLEQRFGAVPHNVVALGTIDRDRLHMLMKASDVFVLTARASVMGTIGREAFALGALVAAVDEPSDYLLHAISLGERIYIPLRRDAHDQNARAIVGALRLPPEERAQMEARARWAMQHRGLEVDAFARQAAPFLLGLETAPRS